MEYSLLGFLRVLKTTGVVCWTGCVVYGFSVCSSVRGVCVCLCVLFVFCVVVSSAESACE